MKIISKVLALMTICGCAALFTACGSTSSDSSTTAQNTTVQTTASQDQKTDAPTEEKENDEDKSLPAETETSDKSDVPESTGKETLVVYFSATGTTKGVAERIAAVTNADIYEIIPAEPYSDADLDWHDKNSRTTIEMNDQNARPAMASDDVNFEGYSTVYIGYPIWWGDAPRIMSTFVEAHDFNGLTVIPFCTSGGSGIGRSGDNLASQAGSGNWLKGGRLEGNISEDKISSWINGLN